MTLGDPTYIKGPIGEKGVPYVYMPWDLLINAFLRGMPDRLKLQEQCMSDNQLFNLREFHVLTIGGPRQCGKTNAVLDMVREHAHARFIKNSGIHTPYAVKREAILQERSLEKVGITQDDLKGVKILVIDNEGYPENELSPYKLLETMYVLHNDWFEPDVMVLRVL